jgi:phospholipase/carboxylesterase
MGEPKLGYSSRSGLVYRYRNGNGDSGPTIILLHGLGGDENSMWILEQSLPTVGLKIAPRALYQMDGNGYSWVENRLQGWPTAMDFESSVEAINNLVVELEAEAALNREELFLMGFSQGAALAFTAAADPRLQPKAVIAAAGFLPKGHFSEFSGLPIFWGHGSRDEWVPIERARSDAILLRDFGAKIHFCETDVGHKLGTECLNGLQDWMEGLLGSQ